jgi:hypothetical protein
MSGNDNPAAWVLAWLNVKTKGIALIVAVVAGTALCVSESEYHSLLPFVPVTVLASLFVVAGWAIRRRLASQAEPEPQDAVLSEEAGEPKAGVPSADEADSADGAEPERDDAGSDADEEPDAEPAEAASDPWANYEARRAALEDALRRNAPH